MEIMTGKLLKGQCLVNSNNKLWCIILLDIEIQFREKNRISAIYLSQC